MRTRHSSVSLSGPHGQDPRGEPRFAGAGGSGRPSPPGAPPRRDQGGTSAGRSPLRPQVPGRLPPGVAAGRGPRQQERDAGRRQEQSGPHDGRRASPGGLAPAPAREGAPGLAPPPGAAGSEPARPQLARGAEQGAGTPRGGAGGREGIPRGWRVSAPRSEAHKRQCLAAAWGGAESRMGSKIGDPWGRGLPLPASLAWLGFGFLRRAVGGRLRPAGGRDWEQGRRGAGGADAGVQVLRPSTAGPG